MEFRTLLANEVDCRVGNAKKKGLTLLLYKDARCDMNVLDETVGAENWQNEYYFCKDTLFCKVGIKIEDEWVWKANAGDESYSEAKKGEASDAFKRACFCWGIGRELYTAPFIWIPSSKYEFAIDNNDKIKVKESFYVDYMEVDDKKKITFLSIARESDNEIVYTFGKAKNIESLERIIESNNPKEESVPFETKAVLRAKALDIITRAGRPANDLSKYGATKDTTREEWSEIVKTLEKEYNEL